MAFLKSKLVAAIVLPLALSLQAAPSPPATAEGEYALKAVFVYNFLRFIDWPAAAFGAPDEPMVIGIIGEDPFGPLLRETVQGEMPRGRNIRIEHYRSPREMRKCHLLFVGRTEESRYKEMLSSVAGKSIVTVGETESFLDAGGMIALTTDRNRIRLTMAPTAMRAASLDVSSKLLRVAEIRR